MSLTVDLLNNPFGKGNMLNKPMLVVAADIKKKYTIDRKEIKLIGIHFLKDDILIHIKIPSNTYKKIYGSKEDIFYDVVFLFKPTNNNDKLNENINNYVIDIYSNSPSFIFTYNYIIFSGNTVGRIKFDKSYIRKVEPWYEDISRMTFPEIRNSMGVISYEKSILYLFFYMIENNLFIRHTLEARAKEFKKFNYHSVLEYFEKNISKQEIILKKIKINNELISRFKKDRKVRDKFNRAMEINDKGISGSTKFKSSITKKTYKSLTNRDLSEIEVRALTKNLVELGEKSIKKEISKKPLSTGFKKKI